jgi:ribonuclease Z
VAQLSILGSGSGFDPHHSNTCLYYEGAKNILIDCGYSGVQAVWRAIQEREAIDIVLLTHHHADHTFGLPNLLVRYSLLDPDVSKPLRKKPLTIMGTPNTEEYIKSLKGLAYHPEMANLTFPLEFLDCVPGETLTYSGITIRTAQPEHQIANLATRYEYEGKCHFAYSSDGKITDATRELYKQVPVLVHCVLAVPGGEGPIHANIEDVLHLAAECEVETLVLVHQRWDQRLKISNYVRSQRIFDGQILQPNNSLTMRVG